MQNLTSANANISKYVYGYDNRDVRTFMERQVGTDPVQRINYGYDTVDQLTRELSTESPVPEVNVAYAYDPMGNRTRVDSGTGATGATTTYSTNNFR